MMRKMQENFRLILLLSVILIVFCVSSVTALEKAPDFTLTDIYGNSFSLNDFRGKVVLLEFFTVNPRCPACELELPHLKAVYNYYSSDNLTIISISIGSQDTDHSLQSYVLLNGVKWIVARDTASLQIKYNIQWTPTLILIDKQGYIRYKHERLTSNSTLISEIDSLLFEPSGNGTNSDGGLSLYTLIGIVVVVAVLLFIAGVIVVGQIRQWSKPTKKRRVTRH